MAECVHLRESWLVYPELFCREAEARYIAPRDRCDGILSPGVAALHQCWS
jgi:hypothetical protein